MTDKMKPVRCGCGGEARVIKHKYFECSPTYGVTCYKCGTATNQGFDTEAEAIEVWNRAIGNRMELQTVKERTAKVSEIATRSYCGECGERLDDYDDICGEPPIKYCPMCGARLEWK